MSDSPLSATELAEMQRAESSTGWVQSIEKRQAPLSPAELAEIRADARKTLGSESCYGPEWWQRLWATFDALQATLQRLAEPDEAVVDGGRVRKTIEAMKAYLTFYEMDDPLNPPTLRQRAAREQGATRLRLWIYGLESAFPNTEPRTPEEAEAIKAAAAMAGEKT